MRGIGESRDGADGGGLCSGTRRSAYVHGKRACSTPSDHQGVISINWSWLRIAFVEARYSLLRELELELLQSHTAQKPVLRGEVGCACVAREVSVERGGIGERGCARRLGGWVWV